MVSAVCAACGKTFERKNGQLRCPRHFCSRSCFWVLRRIENADTRTPEQKKADKSAYDAIYREKNREAKKQYHHEWYKANRNPEKEREARKDKMPRHVEYCRQPQYKAWKQAYDRVHRAKKHYGGFYEAFLLILDIDAEVASRMTRTEIYAQNQTLNKTQLRRREYARTFSNQP